MIETLVPPTISNFIPTQFPKIYQENDPTFIAFVQAYYEWAESAKNPMALARKYYDIKDIDSTFDEFLIYFRNKYLINIKIDTNTDIRQIIKHALDIYRSKGTKREVQLLFQLVYGVDIDIYLPSTDLMRLSDGEWHVPIYLELSLSDNNINLYQKEVKGEKSGAIAFVDNVVRRAPNHTLLDVAFISAIQGHFQTGEKIRPTDGSMAIADCPYMIGSLFNIEIAPVGTGEGYEVGDIVGVTSQYGQGGQFRVDTVANSTGVISFDVIEPGYGYTNTSIVYVSNNVLTVDNLVLTDTSLFAKYFNWQDTVTQPMAQITYYHANGNFVVGANVYTYTGGGSVMGTGIIMTDNQTDTNSGVFIISLLSGSLNNTLYTYSNTLLANVSAYSDITATGKFIANTSLVFGTLSNQVGNFISKETITQQQYGVETGNPLLEPIGILNSTQPSITPLEGVFESGYTIVGQTSMASAVLANVQIDVGVCNIVNQFIASDYSYFYSASCNGNIKSVGTGLSASVAWSNNFIYLESVSVANDIISGYLTNTFANTQYGFPAHPTANLTSNIGYSWTYNTFNIGRIDQFYLNNLGSNYTKAPIIVIDESRISQTPIIDNQLFMEDDSPQFDINEIVTQASTGARGVVEEGSNTTVINILRLNYANTFEVTSGPTSVIVGSASGSVANIVTISTEFSNTDPMGRNAHIDTQATFGNGVLTGLTRINSGYGYIDGEVVTIGESGTGVINLKEQGSSKGYYRVKGGNLSDVKKLFDGDYYQNFSYEIISPIVKNKYDQMIQQVAHVSGTKRFGKFRYAIKDQGNSAVITSTIVVT